MGTACYNVQDRIPVFEKASCNYHHFHFQYVIGQGGFGQVWKVIEKKTQKIYAMKVMDKAKILTKKSVSSVINERQLLSQVSHKFLVNMHCSFQNRNKLYLLMDYFEGGDLRYYLNQQYYFSETEIKFIVRCLMEGLIYLHNKKIIHRDVKPENIIIDDKGYCHLTDLGIARYWKLDNANENSGTPVYMAPQVLLKQNHSYCVDYYAVGVIAYELATRKRPYNGKIRKQVRELVLSKQAKIPIDTPGISPQGQDFINKMIMRFSKKRLGYNGTDEIMKHPWLKISAKEHVQFLNGQMISPLQPYEIDYEDLFSSEKTIYDEIYLENCLILKRPEAQNLFKNYDYFPYMKPRQQNKQPIESPKLKKQVNQVSIYEQQTKSRCEESFDHVND